ncbi:MAG: GNAT family N-acetyltransferase [Candidatus Avispirillum sp.]
MSGKISPKRDITETKRLTLHAFSERDRDAAGELICSEEIKETYMMPDCTTEAEVDRLFESLMKTTLSRERFMYGIYLGERLMGFINEVETDGDSIEVGYVINPRFKNKGYASEALRAAAEELFRMGYKAVRVGAFEENAASRRVAEKCEMKLTGKTERIEYRGREHLCVYYELRRED